jgi:DNA polymerase III subunit epsilon
VGRVLDRLDGVLRAVHSGARLVLAPHPVEQRCEAFWVVDGRLIDWGPLPGEAEVAERSSMALARRRPQSRRVPISSEEVDEVRIVSAWVAEHEPPELDLEEAADERALRAWLGSRRE